MKMLVSCLLLSGALTAGGCSLVTHARFEIPRYPYVVRITVFGGPFESNALDYYFTRETVAVLKVDTSASGGIEEIYNRKLRAEEAVRWTGFIEAFPVDELDTEYRNRTVYDGRALVYHFNIGSARKKVTVVNEEVEPLSALKEEASRLLPDFMAVGVSPAYVSLKMQDLDQNPDIGEE